MKRSMLLRTASLSAIATLSLSAAHAQTVTGSISGTVLDPSNAVVPKATVVTINTETGVRTSTTTNSSGVYSIRFLPIGSYQVEVTAAGFGKLTIPPFALEINQTAKIDAHVTLNSSNSSVEVQANLTPILDTEDGTLGLSLNSDQIETIPLNGRNFSSVTQFQPGALAADPTGLTSNNAIERNTYNSGVVTINGNRAQANNYTLDGVDINETQNNLIGYNVAPDAIQEVRVISANAPATYGNVNGGDIVTVLKSGTNKFHGSLYEFLENQNLEANSFAQKFQGLPKVPVTQSIFGATIGGPIRKDKLFFFADYEGVRNHHAGTGTASVLTARERTGDFSDYTTQLYDPQNGNALFPNNRIPISNPVVQFLIAHPEFYPLPNKPTTSSNPGSDPVQNNFTGSTNGYVVNNQGDVKIEWDPRAKDKITAFYSQNKSSDATTAVLPITFPNQDTYPDHLGGATWVHTLSPSIVNEARVGFTRIRWDSNIPYDSTGAFTNGDALVGIPAPAPQQFVGFAYQGFSSTSLTGVGTPGQAQVIRDNTYSYGDTLTLQHGRQLFTVGAQLLRYQQNFFLYGSGGQLGTFNFNGVFSGQSGGQGYAPADWALDRADQQQVSLSNGAFGQRQYRVAGFIQDDWKVTDKLTINLGLRYEWDEPYAEVNNKTANVILSGPQQGTVEYAGHIPNGAPANSIVCGNPSCYKPTYDQFQPRVGFAYEVTPRLVVRGGYGTTSYLEGNSTGERLVNNPPYTSFSTLQATVPAGTTPGTPFAVQNGFAVSNGSLSVSGFTAYPQAIRPAYLQEFNLTGEYQLNNSTSFQIGYIGETGQRLIDFRNGNQLTLAQARAGAAGPFDKLVGAGNGLFVVESEAYSSYNAAQLTLRHRLTRGLQATINYTYAHSLTNSQGNFGGSNVAGPTATEDGYNLSGDYGPSDSDVRHNLSATGSFDLPFGRGKQFGANTNRAVDLLIGGWRLDATAIAYSGLPITIFGNDNSNTNSYGGPFGGARATQYRPLKIVNRSVAHWFGTDPSATPCTTPNATTGIIDNGTCAYGEPLPFTFGSDRVGSERAPGFEQIDTTLNKDFHITDRQSLGFDGEIYNVFNFASYANPSNNVGNGNFGQITSTRNGPRTVQLALHYKF